jgi:YggT family protein
LGRYLIGNLIQIYIVLIIVRAVLSWFTQDMRHPVVRIIYMITEPLLGQIRKSVKPIGGVVDISPVIAILLLSLLRMIFI